MLQNILSDSYSIHIFNDQSCNLLGVIAIDKKSDYPAIGGTRLIEYHSIDEAVIDAIRLAKNMTFKSILSDIPFLGGKSVLLRPKNFIDKQVYFSSYGDIVENLNGRFVTGCDSGVNQNDMSISKGRTTHITGLSPIHQLDYLSDLTALGVLESMKLGLAAIGMQLQGAKVAIQGVGKVGSSIVKLLKQLGAVLTICDLNEELARNIGKNFECNVVSSEEIYKLKSDIFSPCGLGGVINEKTVSILNCKMVCGAANNQIFDQDLLRSLDNKSILYIPDWICNIGGTIYAAHSYLGDNIDLIKSKVVNVINKRTKEFLDLRNLKRNSLEALESYIEIILSDNGRF